MNRAKLRALVHYIIAKSDPGSLGAIRLNKILFYIDALAFRTFGKSITGETYIKRQFGPVSKHVLSVLGELEERDAIVIRKRLGDSLHEYIGLTEPNVAALTPAELKLADAMRTHICNEHTANSISELSHDHVWEAANIGEKIPLEATLASGTGELTKEVFKWADSVVSRYEAPKRAA